MKIDMEYVLRLLRELMDIPSVAGDCRKILDRTEREFLSFGLPVKRTRKGALLATMKGRNDEEVRLVSAHVDTLGAVVREIKPNGRLRLLQIGGFAWTSFETENLSSGPPRAGTSGEAFFRRRPPSTPFPIRSGRPCGPTRTWRSAWTSPFPPRRTSGPSGSRWEILSSSTPGTKFRNRVS